MGLHPRIRDTGSKQLLGSRHLTKYRRSGGVKVPMLGRSRARRVKTLCRALRARSCETLWWELWGARLAETLAASP